MNPLVDDSEPHPDSSVSLCASPQTPSLRSSRSCVGDDTPLDSGACSPPDRPLRRTLPPRADPNRTPLQVSLTLENCGSVARDHLASERTFLAYVRTSLTIASASVALAQLLTLSERLKTELFVPLKPFEAYAQPLAVASILLALDVLFLGTSRYFSIQAGLVRGLFPVARFRLTIISLVLGAIVSLLFGLLLAERTQVE
ncbi:hypothetical protein DFH09DRAFT_937601 [Mycena vulgaris]|nr:hypothetical protein DFH09DRAFT_937601 [Mycena vulgaris]